jgi:hypothetical protein
MVAVDEVNDIDAFGFTVIVAADEFAELQTPL